MTTVTGVDAMASGVKGMAGVIYTPGISNAAICPATPWGTAANPAVIYVDGNVSCAGGGTGYGILLVTGNLEFKGSTTWNGIVMVIGQGTMDMKGTVSFNGAVFVANTRNSSNVLYSDLTPPQGLGPTSVSPIAGGGHGGVAYDSCWISKASGAPLPRVLAFRETPQ